MTLENMTSKELKAIAKELSVKNWWNLKKVELIAEIEKIQNAQVEPEEVNDENIVEESTDAPESAQVEKKSKRKEDLIEYNGKVQNLSAWAKELGMPGQTLYARLRISKWPVEKAFTTPMRKKKEEEA